MDRKCSKCKVEKPATSEYFYKQKGNSKDGLHSWCKPCFIENRKQKYRANPEIGRATSIKYRQNNSEIVKAKARIQYHTNKLDAKWVIADRGRKAEAGRRKRRLLIGTGQADMASRAWRARNPEVVRATRKKYYERLRQTDPGKLRAWENRARAKRLGAPGSFESSDVNRLFIKQKARCIYCDKKVGMKDGPWEVDHFIPLSKGGSNFPDNLVLACMHCNRVKFSKMPWEFMPEKFSPPDTQAAG